MSELDPMDARLHGYADRWRASSAPPPVVDTDRLPARSANRAWWTAGVAAAAVAAGIAVGTTLVHHDRVAAPPKPAHTVRPGDVVPWAPLPATHPTIPTQTTPPSPDPAEAVGKPACRASDLRATATGAAAAGTYYRNVRLRLVGARPCTLEGYADVQPLDQGRPVDIPVDHQQDDSVYRGPVLVSAGHPALLQLSWGATWCTTPVHNDTVRLVLPGGALTFPGLGSSNCNNAPGSGPKAPIMVAPFQPVSWHEGTVATPYATLVVSGNLELSATPGETVHFTVTLTSPTDLALDPCPDYHLVQVADDGQHEETYALNCAAVPYRDARGRPYLPAGTPVQFEMRTTVVGPAGSTEKLSWALDTVDAKGVGGALTVQSAPAPSYDPGSASPTSRNDALRVALESDPAVWREFLYTDPKGQVLCGLDVLGSTPDGRTLYVWLACGDFVVYAGTAQDLSSGGESALVVISGTGSAVRVDKVVFPRQAYLDADLARMFPPDVVTRIQRREVNPVPSLPDLKAEAVRNAAG